MPPVTNCVRRCKGACINACMLACINTDSAPIEHPCRRLPCLETTQASIFPSQDPQGNYYLLSVVFPKNCMRTFPQESTIFVCCCRRSLLRRRSSRNAARRTTAASAHPPITTPAIIPSRPLWLLLCAVDAAPTDPRKLTLSGRLGTCKQARHQSAFRVSLHIQRAQRELPCVRILAQRHAVQKPLQPVSALCPAQVDEKILPVEERQLSGEESAIISRQAPDTQSSKLCTRKSD